MPRNVLHLVFCCLCLLWQVSATLANVAKIDSLIERVEVTESDTTRVKLLNSIARQSKLIGEFSQALKYAEQALTLAESAGFDRGMANSLNNIGQAYHDLSNEDMALKYYFRSKELYESLDNKKGRAAVYNNIGNVYNILGNYPEALKYHLKSVEMERLRNNEYGMALSYNNIGNIYDNQGIFPSALEYHLRCLKYAEKLGKKRVMSVSYNNIGLVHESQGQYDKALEYYLKCLEIERELGDKHGEAGSYSNIGTIYFDQNNYTKALEYHRRSLKINSQIGHKKGVAMAYQNIGFIYADIVANEADGTLAIPKEELNVKGNDVGLLLDSALYYLNASMKIKREIGFKMGIISGLRGLGEVYSLKGFWNKAIKSYEDAADMAKEIGADQELYESNEALGKIWKQIANCKMGSLSGLKCRMTETVRLDATSCYQKALEYQTKAITLKDSVFNEKREQRLAMLQITYETEKKEKQIAKLNSENLLNSERLKTQKNWLYFIITAGISLLILLGLVFRNLRVSLANTKLKQQVLLQEKQQLDNELQYKSKELESFALHVVEKNEILQSIKGQINSIDVKPENISVKKEIVGTINHNLYLDNDRKELELRIDQANQAFLSKLENKFPNLTKTEKRLCSLLAMEFSSKDIATIMNITPESVKTNRNRLRKKLGLESYTNLGEYLKSI